VTKKINEKVRIRKGVRRVAEGLGGLIKVGACSEND